MANTRLSKSVFLVFILSLFVVGSTNSSFSDTEEFSSSIFSAGTIDFSLLDGANYTNIKPGFNQTKTIKVIKEGSLDFKYKVDLEKTGGDPSFCNKLNITLPPSQPIVFSQSASDININLSFSDNNSSLQNKSCTLNFIFSAWQLESNGTWGLKDKEVIENTITTSWFNPELDFTITENHHLASFRIKNIDIFSSLTYELIYGTDSQDQGLTGEETLHDQPEFNRDSIVLGSCTSGGTCTYHQGVHNLHLIVKLKKPEGTITTLERSLL